MRLYMTEGEICSMYRAAKDKNTQITILAQLNLTERKAIAKILEKHGYTLPKKAARTIVKRGKYDEQLNERYIELIEQGKTAQEVADILKVSSSWVYQYANAHGLSFRAKKKPPL